jgi:hypothetical protein
MLRLLCIFTIGLSVLGMRPLFADEDDGDPIPPRRRQQNVDSTTPSQPRRQTNNKDKDHETPRGGTGTPKKGGTRQQAETPAKPKLAMAHYALAERSLSATGEDGSVDKRAEEIEKAVSAFKDLETEDQKKIEKAATDLVRKLGKFGLMQDKHLLPSPDKEINLEFILRALCLKKEEYEKNEPELKPEKQKALLKALGKEKDNGKDGDKDKSKTGGKLGAGQGSPAQPDDDGELLTAENRSSTTPKNISPFGSPAQTDDHPFTDIDPIKGTKGGGSPAQPDLILDPKKKMVNLPFPENWCELGKKPKKLKKPTKPTKPHRTNPNKPFNPNNLLGPRSGPNQTGDDQNNNNPPPNQGYPQSGPPYQPFEGKVKPATIQQPQELGPLNTLQKPTESDIIGNLGDYTFHAQDFDRDYGSYLDSNQLIINQGKNFGPR